MKDERLGRLAAVQPDPRQGEVQLQQQINLLCDHSMLQANIVDGETRYTMLKLVREYVLAHTT